jgi:hypothetical protein
MCGKRSPQARTNSKAMDDEGPRVRTASEKPPNVGAAPSRHFFDELRSERFISAGIRCGHRQIASKPAILALAVREYMILLEVSSIYSTVGKILASINLLHYNYQS